MAECKTPCQHELAAVALLIIMAVVIIAGLSLVIINDRIKAMQPCRTTEVAK